MGVGTIIAIVLIVASISLILWAGYRFLELMDSSDDLLKAWADSIKNENDLVFFATRFTEELERQGIDPCNLLAQPIAILREHLALLDEKHIDVDKMLAVRKDRKKMLSTFAAICEAALINDNDNELLSLMRKNILIREERVEAAKKALSDAVDVFNLNRQRFPASLLYREGSWNPIPSPSTD